MTAAAPTISDAWIAERWPDEDPAEVRRRFDALMDKLGESPWRGIPHFPGLMADVLAATARLPDERIADLVHTFADMPEHLRAYEWFAGRAAFGGQSVYGDDGHGMGRQAIAHCPGGKRFNLAPFIAAASPKNVFALLSQLFALRKAARALYMAGRWELPGVMPAVQVRLWADLRDALGLPPGTATRARIHDDEPPLPFDRPACSVPPAGWDCTRAGGHEGPCAAVPVNDRPGVEL